VVGDDLGERFLRQLIIASLAPLATLAKSQFAALIVIDAGPVGLFERARHRLDLPA